MGKDKQGGKAGALNRRDFMKTGAAGAVSASIAARAEGQAAQAGGPAVLGPGPVEVTLTVNGEAKKLRVEPRVTLLDALRGRLAITGPKRVCDRGTCGACTVFLNGKLVYACSVLAVEADGSEVGTVEGLGSPESLHPLQAAIVEHDGSQCGFCTPGFVMACKDLLDRHPKPGDREIALGLGGNLCRCGTYAGLKAAVEDMAGRKGGIRNG